MQHPEKQMGISTTSSMASVREMIQACIQCGTCSGSCPSEFAMDHTPRRLWRMVMAGREAQIFHSQTFALCAACYTCALRCPRGLPLTEAMAGLKRIAARRGATPYRQSALFYQSFLQSVRNHGRVREMAFMTRYFTRLKNPLAPLRFASLGIRLLCKGKVGLQLPSRGSGKLAALFEKVEDMERKQMNAQSE